MEPDSGDISYFYVQRAPQGDGGSLCDTIQSLWFYSMLNPKKNLEQQRGMINHFTKNVCHFGLKLLVFPLCTDIFVVTATMDVLI